MPPPERTSVDRYELTETIGSGGMGTVWRAHDSRLRRDVAIKEIRLPPGLDPADRENAKARMVREAQTAARISHPSVVTVHDVLEEDGNPFIVMELLDGMSLQDRLDRVGTFPPEAVARIAREMLGALRASHGADVVHRDIKPANIMLTEDGRRPVLTDFGIANLLHDEGTVLTATGTFVGTTEYMAPERFDQGGAAPPSDLWSLGVSLFAALEGASPFRRDTLTQTLTAVLTQPVPVPRAGEPLTPLIGGLLDRDPDRRLTSEQALDLLDRKGPATATPNPHTPPAPPPQFPGPRNPQTPPSWGPAPHPDQTPTVHRPDPHTPPPHGPTPHTRQYTQAAHGPGPQHQQPNPPVSPPRPSRRRALWWGAAGAAGLVLGGLFLAWGPERVAYEHLSHEYFSMDHPEGWDAWDSTDEWDDAPEARIHVHSIIHPAGDHQIDVFVSEFSESPLNSYEDLTDTAEANARDEVDWEQLRLEREESADSDTSVLEGYLTNDSWRLPERFMTWQYTIQGNRGYSLRISVPEEDRSDYRRIIDDVRASFTPA